MERGDKNDYVNLGEGLRKLGMGVGVDMGRGGGALNEKGVEGLPMGGRWRIW